MLGRKLLYYNDCKQCFSCCSFFYNALCMLSNWEDVRSENKNRPYYFVCVRLCNLVIKMVHRQRLIGNYKSTDCRFSLLYAFCYETIILCYSPPALHRSRPSQLNRFSQWRIMQGFWGLLSKLLVVGPWTIVFGLKQNKKGAFKIIIMCVYRTSVMVF